MSKSVHFSETPDLVRQLSDRSDERKQNSQTYTENKLASHSFYTEEKQKINTDKEAKEKYEKKRKYINTPINKRVSDAISKGSKEAAQIRNEQIAQEHKYDYWWLGGKKLKKNKKTKKTRSKKMRKKSKKNKHY